MAARKKTRKRNAAAFDRCVKSAAKSARDPRAVCAAAGRKKYGAKKFAKMAAAGRKKKARARGNPPAWRASGLRYKAVGRADGWHVIDKETGGTVRTVKTKSAARQVLASMNARARRRSNPEDEAADRYQLFHGREPEDVTTVTETLHEHSVLSGIGKLHSLVVAAVDGQSVVELSGFRGALLSQDENGKQLFIKGGDQSVNLREFGITDPHELEVLGAVKEVVYRTQKDHLGADGGKAAFHHKFGGRGSRLPILGYDVRNKLLSFLGGGYDLPEVGIRG